MSEIRLRFSFVVVSLVVVVAQTEARCLEEGKPQILSAYLGVVDIPIPQVLANVSGCEQEVGDDGMPIVFSVQVDRDSLSPADFAVTTESGAVHTPTCATLAPADEDDELRTVLITGPLGAANDLPVIVNVVGSLLSTNGVELSGLSAEVTLNRAGPALSLAILQPFKTSGLVGGRMENLDRIQLTWQGGVTGRFGQQLGLSELLRFQIIDESGESHIPWGFEDLSDGDNHVVIRVPPGVIPVQVAVEAGTVFDPTNQPNPFTSVDVLTCIE